MRARDEKIDAVCIKIRVAMEVEAGASLDAATEVEVHLAECSACRAYQSDIDRIGAELRRLRPLRFPDDALRAQAQVADALAAAV